MIYIAQRIPTDSWLQEERFEDFRAAYGYAATQTQAIPALAKCHPEELYYAFESLRRGLPVAEPEGER